MGKKLSQITKLKLAKAVLAVYGVGIVGATMFAFVKLCGGWAILGDVAVGVTLFAIFLWAMNTCDEANDAKIQKY